MMLFHNLFNGWMAKPLHIQSCPSTMAISEGALVEALHQQSFHSSGFFSASAAAASAAATIVAGTPFASRFLFGNPKVSHCDAAAAFPEDYISNVQRLSEDIVKNVKNLKNDALKYAVKEYKVELKPLYSAFELRLFAMTTLRSFLMFYLPLLEPATNVEEDDEDFLQDTPKEQHVDLVVPFKKSVKQIIRETTVVTTRRVLERLAVIYVSQRMAWKLLKGTKCKNSSSRLDCIWLS